MSRVEKECFNIKLTLPLYSFVTGEIRSEGVRDVCDRHDRAPAATVVPQRAGGAGGSPWSHRDHGRGAQVERGVEKGFPFFIFPTFQIWCSYHKNVGRMNFM
jgi:hypothetical protein